MKNMAQIKDFFKSKLILVGFASTVFILDKILEIKNNKWKK